MKIKLIVVLIVLFLTPVSYSFAQKFRVATASVHQETVGSVYDGNKKTAWQLNAFDLKSNQYLMLVLSSAGDVQEVHLSTEGLSANDLKKLITLYITYDPMNLGEPVDFTAQGCICF